ncbi:hypothetical protein HK104_009808 [Borealophlyctis nickersoniae]|nr:hypothetical protein HK104_009808 [Borealophlyctis nickersoniae]
MENLPFARREATERFLERRKTSPYYTTFEIRPRDEDQPPRRHSTEHAAPACFGHGESLTSSSDEDDTGVEEDLPASKRKKEFGKHHHGDVREAGHSPLKRLRRDVTPETERDASCKESVRTVPPQILNGTGDPSAPAAVPAPRPRPYEVLPMESSQEAQEADCSSGVPGFKEGDFSVENLLSRENASFTETPCIHADEGWDAIVAKTKEVVERDGIPLVIKGVTQTFNWDKNLFGAEWLRTVWGSNEIPVRNNDTRTDSHMTMAEYMDYICSPSPRDPPRLYGKDLTCPKEWETASAQLLPEFFRYKGANDLIGCLSPEGQVENLMIYVGFHGTWTPGHKDMCGCWGHNIMLDAENDNSTSLWFMAASPDKHKAEAYWREKGQDLDTDDYFMGVEDLANAPFKVYVIEQRVGDFVIVPSETAHQVVNKGGYTVKLAWNRHTPQSLKNCYYEVLPILRRMLKPEIYRNKEIVHAAVVRYSEQFQEMEKHGDVDRIRATAPLSNFAILLNILEDMIKDEWIHIFTGTEMRRDVPPGAELPAGWDKIPYIDNVSQEEKRSCDFCRADIWNRGWSCSLCVRDGAPYDMCLDCFARGRSCLHPTKMVMVQAWKMSELMACLQAANARYNAVLALGGFDEAVRAIPFQTYGLDIFDLMRIKNWICFKCQNVCNCARCTTERSETVGEQAEGFKPPNNNAQRNAVMKKRWVTQWTDDPRNVGTGLDQKIAAIRKEQKKMKGRSPADTPRKYPLTRRSIQMQRGSMEASEPLETEENGADNSDDVDWERSDSLKGAGDARARGSTSVEAKTPTPRPTSAGAAISSWRPLQPRRTPQTRSSSRGVNSPALPPLLPFGGSHPSPQPGNESGQQPLADPSDIYFKMRKLGLLSLASAFASEMVSAGHGDVDKMWVRQMVELKEELQSVGAVSTVGELEVEMWKSEGKPNESGTVGWHAYPGGEDT